VVCYAHMAFLLSHTSNTRTQLNGDNPAEWRYQTVKRLCNTILDQTGAPAYCWLLCLMYVCFVLNNAFLEVIQSTPLCQAYGTNNDISPMLYFSFYEPVFYLVDETTFPPICKDLCRQWVGVSENVGHFMTYKILMDDTRRIIHRSNIRSAADPHARNLRLDPLGDKLPEVIRSLRKASPALDHGEDFSLHSMEPTDEHPYTESTPDPSERPSTRLLLTHKNCWGAPSSWTLRKTVRGSVPASSNAFPTTSPTSAIQTIMSSFEFLSMRTSMRRSSHTTK
jgi:hypothetical protein